MLRKEILLLRRFGSNRWNIQSYLYTTRRIVIPPFSVSRWEQLPFFSLTLIGNGMHCMMMKWWHDIWCKTVMVKKRKKTSVPISWLCIPLGTTSESLSPLLGVSSELCIPLGTNSELFPPLLGVLFELCIPLGITLELFPLLLGVSFELCIHLGMT
jgi:hypothetical protein